MTESTANYKDASPFHHGEQAVQARLGVRDIEDWARKVVRDYLPEQHRAFHTSLPFLVVSARDDAGRRHDTSSSGTNHSAPRSRCPADSSGRSSGSEGRSRALRARGPIWHCVWHLRVSRHSSDTPEGERFCGTTIHVSRSEGISLELDNGSVGERHGSSRSGTDGRRRDTFGG